jgi:hypothetical protein
MNCIFGYFHSAIMGHWKDVNTEMLNTMLKSDLMHEMLGLHTMFVGYDEKKKWFPFKHYNLFVSDHGGSLNEYEYPTLEWLQNDCVDKYIDPFWKMEVGIEPTDNIYIFYCCNAGVSHPPNHDLYPEWRRLMNYWSFTRWKDCVTALEEGYDTVGIEWQSDPVPHWSGNFWWATPEYIATLPPVQNMKTFNAGRGITAKTHPRHGAEWFIGMNPNVKYKSLFQTGYSWRDRPRKDWLNECQKKTD